MRIAHVITRMIVGGAQENTLYNCLDLLRNHGDEVLLITGPALGPEGDLLAQGRAGELPIRMVPDLRRAIHPLRDVAARRALRREILQFGPEIVHTHSAKAGLLGRAVAWAEQIPCVVHTVHGAPFHAYQSAAAREFFIRCERWAAKRCHRMISVADAMTELMVQAGIATPERFVTIYSGMDVEPFLRSNEHRAATRQRLGIDPDEVVIGKIARLFHLKGHDDLVTAAEAVLERHPRTRFLLVGDGILREHLMQRIASMGRSDRFLFTGLVPPDNVPDLIGAMDILVHTSFREGLARALPQALISGRPVVSYDIDGAREVAINDETGFLVPPGDTRKLADSLVTLCRDAELRNRMGRAGQTRFTHRFRHQTMTAEIRRLYTQVLGDSPDIPGSA